MVKGSPDQGGETELEKRSIYPQIKYAHSAYRDQAIGIISIQGKMYGFFYLVVFICF